MLPFTVQQYTKDRTYLPVKSSILLYSQPLCYTLVDNVIEDDHAITVITLAEDKTYPSKAELSDLKGLVIIIGKRTRYHSFTTDHDDGTSITVKILKIKRLITRETISDIDRTISTYLPKVPLTRR